MAISRGSRVLVAVSVRSIKYGWYAPSPEQTLGHELVPDSGLTGLVIGANNIKPARAVKSTATGTQSTFVATNKIADARAANWRVSPSKYTRGASSAVSKLVYVEVNGIKYAWRMPQSTYEGLGATTRTALGIKDVAANDFIVVGASFPKPPRATKFVAASGGQNASPSTSYSTFIDPSKIDTLSANGSIKLTDAGFYLFGEQDSGGNATNN